MATATFTHADQDWDFGQTTYWFRLDGADQGTGLVFNSEVYGVVESGTNGPVTVDGSVRKVNVFRHVGFVA